MNGLALHGLIGDSKTIKYTIRGSESLSATVNNIAIAIDDYEYAVVTVQVDDLISPSKSGYSPSETMVAPVLTSNSNLQILVTVDTDDLHVVFEITQYNRKALKKPIEVIIDSSVGVNDSYRDTAVTAVDTTKTNIITHFTSSLGGAYEEIDFAIVGSELLDTDTVRTRCPGQITNQIDNYTTYIQVVEFK